MSEEPIGWMNGITGYMTMNPHYLKQQREKSMDNEPEHNGVLGEDNDTRILLDHEDERVHIENVLIDGRISLEPAQALSLLAWLKQEEAELRRLTKE